MRRKVGRQPPLFPPFATFGHRHKPYAKIHRFYNQIVYKRHRTSSERRELWDRVRGWPRKIKSLTRKSTKRHGAKVKELTGKSKQRQKLEQYYFATRYSIPPESYYLFRLFENDRRHLAPKFIHRFETKRSAFEILNRNLSQPKFHTLLQDKGEFVLHCRREGFATPYYYFQLSDGEIIPREWEEDSLPRVDLIVKPQEGRGGHAMKRWEYLGEDRYQDETGEVLDIDALSVRFRGYGADVPFVVLQRIEVHPDMVCFAGEGAKILTTCRLLTGINESGRAEVVSATYKLAINQTVADNVHFGGVASPIDVTTGALGPAISTAPLGTPIDVHPTSGARITGTRLPLWEETVDLAQRAHETIPVMFIGWDIGITANGPVLIEGNTGSCVHLQQTPHGKPLGDTRFAELMAYHIDRLDEKNIDYGPRPLGWTQGPVAEATLRASEGETPIEAS